ncbi:restriction endonuclease [Kitasatospora griseola]|uniref:restriction endonuclease n=1 Tax=Kitasatospora griseola TaxID=2064 RepID=UPI0034477A85
MDLTLTLRMRELLSTYKDLRAAPPGAARNRRGQKLNVLIADLLNAWGLTTRHSVVGVDGRDETDVFFTDGQANHILEAKWEAKPINADPLIKLADRLRTRPSGTRGIVVSMSGYTRAALDWVKGNQGILVLDNSHIEAMLCGLLGPGDLLQLLYAETAAAGNRLLSLADVLVPRHVDPGPAPALLRTADTKLSWPVVQATGPGVNASADFSGEWLPTQTPSALTNAPGGNLLITTAAGVIAFHPATGHSTWALPLRWTQDRAVCGSDGSVTVLCRSALVRWHPQDRAIELLAGGFGGYATLEAGRDGALWVFNQVGPLHDGSVTLSRIGEHPGDEQRYDVPFPSGHRAVELGSGRFFLSGNGNSTTLDLARTPITTRDDWIESTVSDPRATAAPDDHTVLAAGHRGGLAWSLHRLDLDQPAIWSELLTLTVNRITDLALDASGAGEVSGWLLADVSGNTPNPTPVLCRLEVRAPLVSG